MTIKFDHGNYHFVPSFESRTIHDLYGIVAWRTNANIWQILPQKSNSYFHSLIPLTRNSAENGSVLILYKKHSPLIHDLRWRIEDNKLISIPTKIFNISFAAPLPSLREDILFGLYGEVGAQRSGITPFQGVWRVSYDAGQRRHTLLQHRSTADAGLNSPRTDERLD